MKGWDKLRQEKLVRQKATGVVPRNTKLSPRHKSVPAWDELDDAKRLVNSWSPKKLAEGANRVAIPKNWRGKSSTQSSSATSLNDQVKKAQALLNQRGFSVGSPDGLLGPKTKRAIMEFQRSAGLPITGKIDSKLLQALDVQT